MKSPFINGCLLVLTLMVGGSSAFGQYSDSKVTMEAKAKPIDAEGKQEVTITLNIEKGWHIYANPVGEPSFENAQTLVKVLSNPALKLTAAYPKGKEKIEKITDKLTLKYQIYEGNVTIQTQVERIKGDSTPIILGVNVSACDDKYCLMGSVLKAEIK